MYTQKILILSITDKKLHLVLYTIVNMYNTCGITSLKTKHNLKQQLLLLLLLSGRAVASPYLGMVLVFMGFGRFQVSETAINQPQNVKLMREMQSTGQTDPI